MIKKITSMFTTGGNSPEDKSLNKLNFLLYILLTCIGVYGMLMLYSVQTATNAIQHSQESIKAIVMLPQKFQIGGLANETNTAIVSTNITREPTKIQVNDKVFLAKKTYERGDVVLVKYFNIYGVIIDKSSLLKDYYRVIYRDNNHRLDNFEMPVDFLLAPTPDALNPFIFTP